MRRSRGGGPDRWQAGRKAEAISSYKDFLSHFENSNAKLPQIAEARAALKRLM